jgi:hypothetical protein
MQFSGIHLDRLSNLFHSGYVTELSSAFLTTVMRVTSFANIIFIGLIRLIILSEDFILVQL